MEFVRRHWRGEYSLARSFWLHLFALGIVLRWFYTWLVTTPMDIPPVIGAQIGIAVYAVASLVIYPWQIVGTWRSANKSRSAGRGNFAPGLVQVLIVIGALATISGAARYWPTTQETLQIAVGRDPFGAYSLELTEDGTKLVITGALSFGVSEKVRKLLARNDAVEGVVLTSPGGRVYEGRALRDLIEQYQLATFVKDHCYSSCIVAFVAGDQRYLISGSVLGFHQYHSRTSSPYESVDDVQAIMAADREYLATRGIDSGFLERIYHAGKDDLWYPTIAELTEANVIRGVVSHASVGLPSMPFDAAVAETVFRNLSPYREIAEHAPEQFEDLMRIVRAEAQSGLSEFDLKEIAATHLHTSAEPLFGTTSNRAIIHFVTESVEVLKMLNRENAAACIAWMFPDAYGGAPTAANLSMERQEAILAALGEVVVDAYRQPGPPLDTYAAQTVLNDVYSRFEAEVDYFDPAQLTTNADYSRACTVAITFFESFLSLNDSSAGNALRYLYSTE